MEKNFLCTMQHRDKTSGVVNEQEATVIASERDIILLKLPNHTVVFVYPVTMADTNGQKRTRYPLIPGYGVTICKSQGLNTESLLLWLDCPFIPRRMGYVDLSRVRQREDIWLLQPIVNTQLHPVEIV